MRASSRCAVFLAAQLLPLAATAQDTIPLPTHGVETVYSDGDPEIEDVTARPGWSGTGTRPLDYQYGTGDEPNGKPVLLIRARSNALREPGANGTLIQTHPPGRYLGKRLRLAARIKTENVSKTQLSLRIEGDNARIEPLALYDMANNPIRETTDWKKYEIVLDVPEGAQRLIYGFSIAGGRGQAYMDNVTLQVVGNDVAVTGARLNAAPRF